MKKIPLWLSQCSTLWFTVYATMAAFMTYFSMYAFRKPFTASNYEGMADFSYGIDFKTALILAQVLGYALSKFIGIKVISEMNAGGRALAILTLVMTAELALVLFAMVPPDWKLLTLFLNGLPLGMIWGLVFSFLEGRRVSEILGAGLSVSFIVSSGVVKTVGQWLMLSHDITEFWMPAITGLVFTLPLFISVFFLMQIPKPSAQDIAARHERQPMDGKARMAFFTKYAPGLIALIFTYMLLTGIRDYTDNFAAELWTSLGFGNTPAIFSTAALYTSLFILLTLGLLMFVKNNMRAFMANHGFIFTGIAVIGLSTLAYQFCYLSGQAWMIIHSTGIYLAYIPFNCLLFDRMLSVINDKGNAGFLIYLADAMGYAGSVGILLYKSFFDVKLSWLDFMINSSYLISITGCSLVLVSAWYFHHKVVKPLRLNPQLG
ncbi:hypothetical protein SG34_031860 [Thalassomonas viridans]|uniref:MFS transporter n=1 Tax=Thalassomonas viridans TaxID=137584 RepID=A0AAF0CDE2_9GAMM|nr:DUF5690 family protein [Thalassomonas viridans]WDE08520.1 hypothetical protein SG34_031860 [Thalassomonas viridans]